MNDYHLNIMRTTGVVLCYAKWRALNKLVSLNGLKMMVQKKSSDLDGSLIYEMMVTQKARYKARLVAKGFSQIQGINFDETYASIADTTSICAFFVMAARDDLEMIWRCDKSIIKPRS